MKYFQNTILFVCLAMSLVFCKQKSKDAGEEAFFPALSFIKSQVSHIDTSLYPIMKITTIDNLSDTVYVKREEFRKLAEDFLLMPDISEKKYKKKYEEQRIFDQSLNRVLLIYKPLKEGLEVQKQEIIIKPDPSGDKVRNIIIELQQQHKDSSVSLHLLWQVNESFHAVKTIQKKNQPEKTIFTQVIWNKKEE